MTGDGEPLTKLASYLAGKTKTYTSMVYCRRWRRPHHGGASETHFDLMQYTTYSSEYAPAYQFWRPFLYTITDMPRIKLQEIAGKTPDEVPGLRYDTTFETFRIVETENLVWAIGNREGRWNDAVFDIITKDDYQRRRFGQ